MSRSDGDVNPPAEARDALRFTQVTPLRLMIHDQSCRGRWGIGLTRAWSAGGRLYGALGRLDHHAGFGDWPSALRWLAEVEPERPIGEIQLWCHGKWGCALLDGTPLDASALRADHPWSGALAAIRDRLGPEPLWWFRTCETFGAAAGHRFARAWTDFFGGRAAGHTHVIGVWQSGLHSLAAGDTPAWSDREGLVEGSPDRPMRAASSGPAAPNTITCFHGAVPEGY